jgi:hypothetical protein
MHKYSAMHDKRRGSRTGTEVSTPAAFLPREGSSGGVGTVYRVILAGRLAGRGSPGPWQHGCLSSGGHAGDRAVSRVRFGRWTTTVDGTPEQFRAS